jgi:hypothetical protein
MTFKQKKEELLASLRGIGLEDPPTAVTSDGAKVWKNEGGKWHREGDKPAIVYVSGTQFWCKNGKIHRDGDKPAIIYADGSKAWWKNDKRHRDGGKPAIIYADGTKEWWVNGKQIK